MCVEDMLPVIMENILPNLGRKQALRTFSEEQMNIEDSPSIGIYVKSYSYYSNKPHVLNV